MTLDLVFFAVAIPAVLFAGISKGGFAGGAAFVATPILALLVPPGAAVGTMLPLLMVMDASNLRPYWRKWDGEAAKLMLVGALPGVALGAALFRLTDPDVFRLLIGAISIGFVAFQLSRKSGLLRLEGGRVGPGAGLLAGATAGFTSFISNAGGPPAAVYLLAKGVPKTRYQATTVIVFWVINMLKFIPFLTLGIANRTTLHADLLLFPFALLGTWIGVKAHRAIPERVFFGVTYVLLVVIGVKLIHDGLA